MAYKIKIPKSILGCRVNFVLQVKILYIGLQKPKIETVGLKDVFKLMFFKKVKTTQLEFIDKQEVVYIELGVCYYLKFRDKYENYVPFMKLFTIFKQRWFK